jgi:hypothetical protein
MTLLTLVERSCKTLEKKVYNIFVFLNFCFLETNNESLLEYVTLVT